MPDQGVQEIPGGCGGEIGVASYLRVPCVEGSLDGNDELGNDWQDLAASCLEHVLHPLHCQELVGLLCFPHPIKEDGQVVVVVQLAHIHLYIDNDIPLMHLTRSHSSCAEVIATVQKNKAWQLCMAEAVMLDVDKKVIKSSASASFCTW